MQSIRIVSCLKLANYKLSLGFVWTAQHRNYEEFSSFLIKCQAYSIHCQSVNAGNDEYPTECSPGIPELTSPQYRSHPLVLILVPERYGNEARAGCIFIANYQNQNQNQIPGSHLLWNKTSLLAAAAADKGGRICHLWKDNSPRSARIARRPGVKKSQYIGIGGDLSAGGNECRAKVLPLSDCSAMSGMSWHLAAATC